LQDLLGTSRQPIRSALGHLAEQGVLEWGPNKGFFLKNPGLAVEQTTRADDSSEEAVYLRIADDRLTRKLPDRISGNDLMRRYTVSRLALRRILTRISSEGWIERNEGRGWTFAALIDSVEAYRECYDLRQVIEVHGLRSPDFRLDRAVLAELRRLVEYRQTLNIQQVIGQNAEHLAILDALDAQNTARAADLMHAHLGKAKQRKARAEMF